MKKTIFLTAFLLATPAFAQVEDVGGSFYAACGPTDGAAVTMELDTHLRITVYGVVKPDEAYRTKGEVFDGEKPSMEVSLCDAKDEKCQSIEGVLTTYKIDDEVIEGAIEYFDGTETQGDSESIQGHVNYFKVKKDAGREKPQCG